MLQQYLCCRCQGEGYRVPVHASDMVLRHPWPAVAATAVDRQPRPPAHTSSAAGGCAAGARPYGAPPQCVHHHTALAGAAHALAVGSHGRGSAPHPASLQGIGSLPAMCIQQTSSPNTSRTSANYTQSRIVAGSLRTDHTISPQGSSRQHAGAQASCNPHKSSRPSRSPSLSIAAGSASQTSWPGPQGSGTQHATPAGLHTPRPHRQAVTNEHHVNASPWAWPNSCPSSCTVELLSDCRMLHVCAESACPAEDQNLCGAPQSCEGCLL